MNTGGECLIVSLQARGLIVATAKWPLVRFRLDGELYRDVDLGDWTGFYDWLRKDHGVLVGVRYLPTVETEPLEPLFAAAKSLSYARLHPDASVLDIFFRNVEAIDNRQSADQAFLYCPVFQSERGTWALAFDISRLSEGDLINIKETAPRWGEVRTVER